jgi:hypothetical protein
MARVPEHNPHPEVPHYIHAVSCHHVSANISSGKLHSKCNLSSAFATILTEETQNRAKTCRKKRTINERNKK